MWADTAGSRLTARVNASGQAELDRLALARQLVRENDPARADIFVKRFSQPNPQIPMLEIIQGKPPVNGPVPAPTP